MIYEHNIQQKIIQACIRDHQNIDTYQDPINTLYRYVITLVISKKAIIKGTHIAKINDDNYILGIMCYLKNKNSDEKCMTIFAKCDIKFEKFNLLIPNKLYSKFIYLFNFNENIYLCNYEKEPMIYQLFIADKNIIFKKYNDHIQNIFNSYNVINIPLFLTLDNISYVYLQIMTKNIIIQSTSYRLPTANQLLAMYINSETKMFHYENTNYQDLIAITPVIKYNDYYIGIFSYIESNDPQNKICFCYFKLQNNADLSMIKIKKINQEYFIPNNLTSYKSKIRVSGYVKDRYNNYNSTILEYEIDAIINSSDYNLQKINENNLSDKQVNNISERHDKLKIY